MHKKHPEHVASTEIQEYNVCLGRLSTYPVKLQPLLSHNHPGKTQGTVRRSSCDKEEVLVGNPSVKIYRKLEQGASFINQVICVLFFLPHDAFSSSSSN